MTAGRAFGSDELQARAERRGLGVRERGRAGCKRPGRMRLRRDACRRCRRLGREVPLTPRTQVHQPLSTDMLALDGQAKAR